MEGSRKFLTCLVFGLLSLAALALILLLKQFSVEVFKAWITGTASVFGVYQAANVVAKFSPEAKNGQTKTEAPAAKGKASSDGLIGLSGYIKRRIAEKKAKANG